jgi:hypothetical protein
MLFSSIIVYMAPPIQKVRLQNVLYNVEIINSDMESIVLQIQRTQESIALLQGQITRELRSISVLNEQLITLYIQATGTFPSS